MTDKEELTLKEFHRKMAVDNFNRTWDLLDKTERSQEEIDSMIHGAHASRFHWGQIGEPLHFERGEWQISRVYVVLGRPEPALFHAQRCLAICQENEIGDFDLAFAQESMARAYAVAGDSANRDEHLRLANEAGDQIEKIDDRDYFFSELNNIPTD